MLNVRTGDELIIADFPGYSGFRLGPGEGNLSHDGRWIAPLAVISGKKITFAYDMEERKKYPDIDLSYMESIDWTTLFFFAGLFVMVGGVEKSGLTQLLGTHIGALAHGNLLMGSLFLVWSSALICTVVNRVPYTAAMIPVISHISTLGVNIKPLWWSLAMGVGLGGNATPIGTTAGIAMMGISERTAHPIGFKIWLKSGILVTLTTTLLASLFMILWFTLYT